MERKSSSITIALFCGLATTVAVIALMSQRPTSVRADPGVLYVAHGADCGDASPCYAAIQDAVDAASDGDTVQPDVYRPDM